MPLLTVLLPIPGQVPKCLDFLGFLQTPGYNQTIGIINTITVLTSFSQPTTTSTHLKNPEGALRHEADVLSTP